MGYLQRLRKNFKMGMYWNTHVHTSVKSQWTLFFFSFFCRFRYFGGANEISANVVSVEISDDAPAEPEALTKPPFDSFKDLQDIVQTLRIKNDEDKKAGSKQSYEGDGFPTMGELIGLSPQ